jgi:outer membrane receptor for ferrienterochelin and colicin
MAERAYNDLAAGRARAERAEEATRLHCRLLRVADALSLPQPSRAQAESAPSDGEQKLDSVQITGSRLSRTDAETPSPVQVVTRDEIVRSGAVSLNEVLQKPSAAAMTCPTSTPQTGQAAIRLGSPQTVSVAPRTTRLRAWFRRRVYRASTC